ncbi:AAA family ATPase [Colwellia sp. C1TZA3]|uniref:AAA family ATPase n=1 Tax=Colwellia sp. C1TZA3 TaxID=2508879 RepID=UPI0011BA4704|nr:AAA family ATPase [Colwellia sp. C1TZA3]TWX73796.1 ATP-binding protein [Colwellia sp. C1TZA3]
MKNGLNGQKALALKDSTSKVTVLIGPPCVGKTSYLNTFDYDFVISSDDIVDILTKRAGIYYHEFFKYPSNSNIKITHNKIFEQLIKESKNFKHVVWDLTNLTKRSRKRIFNFYPLATFKAVVFDFQGSESLILKRNQLRFKQQRKYVDEIAIKNMFLSYESVGDDEGFTDLVFINIQGDTAIKVNSL